MSQYSTVIVNLLTALGRNLDKGIQEKIRFAGANTGNLIFTEAMKEQLKYSKEIWLNPNALVGIECPSVVIPSANFLIPGGNSLMESMIRFLEQTDCPVTLAGLGAQAGMDQMPDDLVSRLSPVQIRALKMISERAVSIGVRGEYTASCLNLLGIKNIRIIGCPSFYFNFGRKKIKINKPNFKRVQVSITPGNEFESKLLEIGHKASAFWVMQTEAELPQLAFEFQEWDPEWTELFHNTFPQSKLTEYEIWHYMKNNSYIFFNKIDWDKFYKDNAITFAFGSRFHGNMQAFRNGIPALWVVHDRRTEELISTLHLPSIHYEDISELEHVEQLVEYCDYRDFKKHYKKLYKGYIRFLNENHLEHIF